MDRAMKRSCDSHVDELAGYDSLCAQRDALDARCRDCIRPLHEAVFALDPILDWIVQWLARWHRVAVVGRLASVCRVWEAAVRRVTHVNLGHNVWGRWQYTELLGRYTCATSLHSHPKILLEEFEEAQVAHIATLVLDEPDEYDFDPCEYNISAWTGLRELTAPVECGTYRTYLRGLTGLTALTALTCAVSAFGDQRFVDRHEPPENLLRLTHLLELRIEGFPESLALRQLPRLRVLHSDRAHHFVDFTGSGVLNASDSEASPAELALMSAYDGARTGVLLSGEWRHGVFSGDARTDYGANNFYRGGLCDNRRHGPGLYWDYNEHDCYTAHWAHGQLHGELQRRDPEDKWLQRVATIEQWDRGTLVSTTAYRL
jgi:hypothetical protein